MFTQSPSVVMIWQLQARQVATILRSRDFFEQTLADLAEGGFLPAQ